MTHTHCFPKWQVLLIQAVYLFLGIGILVPWNAFISAKSYFESRLCKQAISSNVESIFATVFNLSSVVTMGLIILMQWTRDQTTNGDDEDSDPTTSATISESLRESETPLDESNDGVSPTNSNSKYGHSFLMVTLSLTLCLVAFVAHTIVVLIMDLSSDAFEMLTLVSLALCGACTSIGSAGIVATAGLFTPDMAMNPYLAGQSFGGILVSLANFIAASWEDPCSFCNDDLSTLAPTTSSVHAQGGTCGAYARVDWAVFCYFLSGSIVLVLCLLGYWYIDRFHRTELHRGDYETVQGDAAATDQTETVMPNSPRVGLQMQGIHSAPILNRTMKGLAQSVSDDIPSDHRITSESTNSPSHEHHDHDSANDMLSAWKLTKGPSVCIFLTFFVTLSLFPGWTSTLRSVRRCRTGFRMWNDLYTPFSFVLFNVGDFTGRVMSPLFPIKQVRNPSEKLVIASLLRFVSFPLLFLCVGGSNNDARIQIPSDLYSLVVQFLFAFTNGFFVSSAFVLAPSLLPDSMSMKERMSDILQFALAFGLLTGSFFSFTISKLIS